MVLNNTVGADVPLYNVINAFFHHCTPDCSEFLQKDKPVSKPRAALLSTLNSGASVIQREGNPYMQFMLQQTAMNLGARHVAMLQNFTNTRENDESFTFMQMRYLPVRAVMLSHAALPGFTLTLFSLFHFLGKQAKLLWKYPVAFGW